MLVNECFCPRWLNRECILNAVCSIIVSTYLIVFVFFRIDVKQPTLITSSNKLTNMLYQYYQETTVAITKWHVCITNGMYIISRINIEHWFITLVHAIVIKRCVHMYFTNNTNNITQYILISYRIWCAVPAAHISRKLNVHIALPFVRGATNKGTGRGQQAHYNK